MEEMIKDEMITNEVVNETAGDVATAAPANGLKTVAKVGGIALVGFGIYKLGKWAIAKLKARKQKRLASENNAAETAEVDHVEITSTDAE